MKPIATSLAVLLWLAGDFIAVARSRSSPVPHDAKKLRGPAALVQPIVLSTVIDKDTHGSGADVDVAVLRGGNGRGQAGKRRSGKPGGDNDTLAHELVDQSTTQPGKKEFDTVDSDKDGNISLSEYLASTRAPRRVARYRFNCTDVNLDSRVDLKEFAAAQAAPQDMERCISMLLAFQMVDKNRDGQLSQTELWKNVGQTNFDSRWAFMIACSDVNGDGKVAPMEFSTDMYGCIEEKSAEAAQNFAEFKQTDSDGNGCANETEMIVAVRMLFGLSLIPSHLVSARSPSQATEDLTNRWINCVDFDNDQCLTKQEYNRLLNPTPEQAQCIGVHYTQYETDMDFQIMDTSNDGSISKQEYYAWCDKLDIPIDHQEANSLFSSADADGDGFITHEEFDSAGEEHTGDGHNVFFLRSLNSTHSIRSLTAWRSSIQKTLAGLFKPP